MSLWARRSALAMVLGVFGWLDAQATTLSGITQDGLIREAQLIVYATPVAQRSQWRAGRIISTFTLEVNETFAGPNHSLILVELLGGTVNGIAQRVSGVPTLELRQPKLFFLHASSRRKTFVPIQLGLGVYERLDTSELWVPMTGDVRNLGPVPKPLKLDRLRAKIRTLRGVQ